MNNFPRIHSYRAAPPYGRHPSPPGRARARGRAWRRARLAVTVALGALLLGCDGGSGGSAGPTDRPPSTDGTAAPRRSINVPPPGSMPALPPPMFTLWVRADAPEGGDGSAERPLRAISAALAAAGPGDAVSVGPGLYQEHLTSVRAGEPDAPIRLVGSGAEIRGDGRGRLVQLTHDAITLEGFRLTGADVLLWVQNATRVRVLGNTFSGAASECVHLKYFARGNEVAHNRIEGCGAENFDLDEEEKNGEGIYIGTAPERVSRNPTDEPDDSGANWVHDNSIQAPAECVDVKEGSRGNLIEGNDCAGSRDPDGAGFSSRGVGTVFRANRSTGHAGAGIRLGGDEEGDGVDSVVVGNALVGNRGYGLKVVRPRQGLVCGNTVADNGDGPVTKGGPDPRAPCP